MSDPSIIDHETGKPLSRRVVSPNKSPHRPRLQTLRDAVGELARTYREHKRGLIDLDTLRSRAYALRTLGSLIEVADLEQRIAQLEQARALPSNGDGQALLPAPERTSLRDDDGADDAAE